MILFVDTETGGLRPATKFCLLSIGVVICDDDLNVQGVYGANVSPPVGTLLEIPVREHQFVAGLWTPRIEYFMDVYTGQLCLPSIEPAHRISAGAAQVNGFIKKDGDGKWDLDSVAASMQGRSACDSIYPDLLYAISQVSGGKDVSGVVAFAHNAPFDKEYVETYVPDLAAAISNWQCSMAWMRVYLKEHKIAGKGTSTLDALCKLAGYERTEAHGAEADAMAVVAGVRFLRDLPELQRLFNGLGANK